MVTQLSDEQRTALEQGDGEPIYVDDPIKRTRYVLIPADAYDKIRALLDSGIFDISETYAAQEQALGMAGWNDPAMDDYNYDSHQNPPCQTNLTASTKTFPI
jgi:hypothetical protein